MIYLPSTVCETTKLYQLSERDWAPAGHAMIQTRWRPLEK